MREASGRGRQTLDLVRAPVHSRHQNRRPHPGGRRPRDVWGDRALAYRIDLLGPVSVSRDGTPVPLAGTMPRALLARLALDPGVAVSAEQLIADLWASPPASATGSLRAQVSRLKHGPLGEVIRGGRGGYALELAAEAVDALLFRALVAEAHTLTDAQRRAEPQQSLALPAHDAHDLLVDAELLWTGPPLDGLDGVPFANRLRATLLDEKRAAAEQLAHLQLGRGEPEQVARRMRLLVQEHPLHENPALLLATATARLGRTTEALEVIDGFAERSQNLAGLDPSSRMRALRQAIVRQERTVSPDIPAVGAAVRRAGLPLPLAGFHGRRRELAAIEAAREHSRLVTLVGPGGVGKTRLAVESARRATWSDDQVQWMLELAPLRLESDLLPALAEIVGARAPTLDAVIDELAERRGLLILDNAEHLRGGVASLCRRLLESCAGLALLVTSREPVRVPGEHLVAVEPLLGRALDTAVTLFSDRAAASDPAFTLDEASRAQVRRLCLMLDGLPLALELAAGRMRALGLVGVLASIESDAGHLGPVTAGERQSSLANTIEWSAALLSAEERVLLGQLGNFAGSFSLDAVAGICRLDAADAASGGEGAADVTDTAIGLIQKSLVAAEVTPYGRRYRLLESVRLFARRLPHTEPQRWFERHRQWYAGLVIRLDSTLRTDSAALSHARLDDARADLRLALENALAAGDRDNALTLAGRQAWHWFRRGSLDDGRMLLDAALAVPGTASAEAEARAYFGALMMIYRRGDPDGGRSYAFDGLAAAERSGDPTLLALFLACTAMWGAREHNETRAAARMNRAMTWYERAEPWARSEVRIFRSITALYFARPAVALDELAEAVRIASAAGHSWAATAASERMAHILIALRRGPGALRLVAGAVRRAIADNDVISVLAFVQTAAGACAVIDAHRDGAVLLGALDRNGVRSGYRPADVATAAGPAYRDRVRQGLSQEEWRIAHAEGENTSLADALALIGRLAREQGPA